jgi:hypothetical protein
VVKCVPAVNAMRSVLLYTTPHLLLLFCRPSGACLHLYFQYSSTTTTYMPHGVWWGQWCHPCCAKP